MRSVSPTFSRNQYAPIFLGIRNAVPHFLEEELHLRYTESSTQKQSCKGGKELSWKRCNWGGAEILSGAEISLLPGNSGL